MTKEELLTPRYRVIGEWPEMLERFYVGYIFEHPYGRTYLTEQSKYDPKDFPNLFEKIEWWEERSVEDMPFFVTQTDRVDSKGNPLPNVVLKIKNHFRAGNGEWRDDSVNIFCADDYLTGLKNCTYNYCDWLPATEQQILEYKDKHNEKKEL